MSAAGAGDGLLVVGYGNGLRSDDGVGRAVAERLADDPRLAEATILSLHQLTPELAVDVSRARTVVFVDAALGAPAGQVSVDAITAAGAAAAGSSSSSFTHHLDAARLVGLATGLFGGSPRIHVVTVGAATMDVGDRLSADVAAAVPVAAQTVIEVARGDGIALAPERSKRAIAHA